MNELIGFEPGTNAEICGATYWQPAKRDVARVVGLPEDWGGSWEPLARWLAGGGTGHGKPRSFDDVLQAITNQIQRTRDYEPPGSLKLFQRSVLAYGQRRGRRG